MPTIVAVLAHLRNWIGSGDSYCAETAFDLTQINIHYQWGGIAGIDGPNDVEIYYSTDGVTFSGTPDQTFGAFNQDGPLDATVDEAQVTVSGTGVTNVRFIFDPQEQWVFLTEIEFEGAAAASGIPEPSTFALAALGLLSLGFVARRRRRR